MLLPTNFTLTKASRDVVGTSRSLHEMPLLEEKYSAGTPDDRATAARILSPFTSNASTYPTGRSVACNVHVAYGLADRKIAARPFASFVPPAYIRPFDWSQGAPDIVTSSSSSTYIQDSPLSDDLAIHGEVPP